MSCDDKDLGLALDPAEETVALAAERAAATAILEAEAVAAAEAHREPTSSDVNLCLCLPSSSKFFHAFPDFAAQHVQLVPAVADLQYIFRRILQCVVIVELPDQAAHAPAADEDEATLAARLEALAAAVEAAKAQVHQVQRGRALKHGATAREAQI